MVCLPRTHGELHMTRDAMRDEDVLIRQAALEEENAVGILGICALRSSYHS